MELSYFADNQFTDNSFAGITLSVNLLNIYISTTNQNANPNHM